MDGMVSAKPIIPGGPSSCAKAEVQTNAKDRESIIIHEIPYQVNKAHERVGEMVRDKTIEGISIRDIRL